MAETARTVAIDAPVEKVFDTIAHIDNYSEAVPHITDVEFLTERRRGVGTRFRETRVMGRRTASTELEVTEYDDGARVRIVSDAGGTIWDTVFTTARAGGGTELTMVMDARPYTLLARLVNPLVGRMVSKGIDADLRAVKAHCERR